uniref:TM2 domain-containing protein 3 n=1 Tax=Phallusia mammillata TaxID=59560 RepID=A0A6F9DVF0_9ASCI|nr:TM2 domain-containing protein 3-like [Phallusia mammillata]
MEIKRWTFQLLHFEVIVLSLITSKSFASSNSKSKCSETMNVTTANCEGNCSNLPACCYSCQTSDNCTYGENVKFNCSVLESATCTGDRVMLKTFQCRYCFLTKPNDEHICYQNNTTCKVVATPRQRVKASCSTNDYVFCLGNRNFTKMVPCNWTSGYSWSAAFVLSITLGGFGIDRFYLGYWREGLGKFFSFGGLGVWTLIDVILIATGYLGPSDGSLYVR